MLESRRVVVRCCVRWLLAGAAVTWSALAPALGLGDITLHSALNQPLRAEIALVDAAGLEEGELSVSLATPDEFSRAGVERVFFLNDLKFTPVLRGDRSLIQVTSHKPVNEPFLNLLVQLNQPNGRLLREYTVLIDPPGAPGIVPAGDEPPVSRLASAFPSVQPAAVPAPAPKEPLPKPSVAPEPDPLAEQLAASVLQNQQLQASIDELNAQLQAQDEQIAGDKQQVLELQSQMAELRQAPAEPVAPVVVAPAPVVVEEPRTNWLLIGGLMLLVTLGGLAVWLRRQRQQAQEGFGLAAAQPSCNEPLLTVEPVAHSSALQAQTRLRNAGLGEEKLQEVRTHHPKPGPVAPAAVATSIALPMATMPEPTPVDEFQLMDTHWDLGTTQEPLPHDPPLSDSALPEPEIEWEIDPVSRSLDGSFLDEFSESGSSLELEPLNLEPPESSNADKLEQA